jgi:exonuclease III
MARTGASLHVSTMIGGTVGSGGLHRMVGDTSAVGIMSLNVGGLPFSLPAPERRLAELCRRIEGSDVDILNLQEVWSRRRLGFVRARLPSFGYRAWWAGVGGQPAGGLVTFSRLPLGAVSYTSFRGTGALVGSPLFRGLKALNGRLQGVLTVELAGRRAVVGNVHLSANRDGDWSAGNRHYEFQRAQVMALHRALRCARTPQTEVMVLGGDLNIASTGPLYALVTGDGAWRDPFRSDDRPTFHPELLGPGRTSQRIDYLLVAGDARRYPVVRADLLFAEMVALPGGRRTFLSDHLALMARVGLPAG